MMKSVTFVLMLMMSVSTQAQMFWQRPVVNYNRHEYNAGNQNWMIDQHKNGWMYFANNKGLLEYDGEYWNLYPLPHQTKLRSLKIANDQKIYVGGLKEFGYFAANKYGGLDYHSLSKRLNPHTVSNIWHIHTYKQQIFFQGDRFIFCYDKGKLHPIDCNGVSFSAMIDGRLYFSNTQGLAWYKDKKIHYIPRSSFLGKANIVAILPYHQSIMIVTREQGVWLYDGRQFSKPFAYIDQLLATHKASCAAMQQGTLAIGTSDSGLYLVDLPLRHIESISVGNGLQNKSLISLDFDQNKNLWLGLDNGIDYISLDTHIYFLQSKLTSIGAGYCSLFYDNKLFLGTNQGIYKSNLPTSVNTPVEFHALPEMTGLIHCMYAYDGKMFCGGRKFFAMMDGSQIHQFDKRGVWHIQAIGSQANTLLIGTYWGLEVMRKENGKWMITNKIANCKISAKSMFIEPESGNVWLANKSDGLWRITLDTNFKKALYKKCYNNKLLPVGDNTYIARINKQTVIASRQGLFRYDYEKDQVVPYPELESHLDGHKAYTYIKQDAYGNIWYTTQGTLKKFNTKTQRKIYYLVDNMIEDFEDVFSLNQRNAIVGTEDGFALIDIAKDQLSAKGIQPQIRKLYTTNGKDSLIYGRSITGANADIAISYSKNSIRIEYGCNNYNRMKKNVYSYRLKGLNKKWSEYTDATSKDYNDLPEGSYTFEIKIQTDDNKRAAITSLSFRVLPPWYRSWWAYSIYLLLFAYAIYYSINKYKRGRERLIRLKDAEINRQKYVFERDIDKKDKQINQLEEEKLRNELEYKSKELTYKSDELVKSTLNVVRKNEMLQKIRKDAESLSNMAKDGNLVNIRRGIFRLITQIDINIEHDDDLDNFQTSFDAVHDDFFKKLDAEFPQLTHKDKMLCAYIKMNLMSKEIAPLLNISVRGVEISRYRLRKKLGLSEKANLAEYLQKF